MRIPPPIAGKRTITKYALNRGTHINNFLSRPLTPPYSVSSIATIVPDIKNIIFNEMYKMESHECHMSHFYCYIWQ
jgi:hypothetical protein